MRILGIDPGFATVGYGVIDKSQRGAFSCVDFGTIVTSKDVPFPKRLKIIADGIQTLVEKFSPTAVAVEELFFNTNITTGINVAHARGVILLTCERLDVALFEYTPLQVKQTLTGNGRAEKKQIQYMVQSILNLSKPPKPDDAADALAIALTHANMNQILRGSSIDTAVYYKESRHEH